MNGVSLWVTAYVINAVWQVGAIAFAGWALARAASRIGPEWQHRIWVAALIFATLVPATPLLRAPFRTESAAGHTNASPTAVVIPTVVYDLPLPAAEIVLNRVAIDGIAVVYGAALLFFLLRLSWQLRATAALVRNAFPAPLDSGHHALWESAKQSIAVADAAWRLSREVPGPVAAGFLRPVVLLPEAFLDCHSRAEFLAAVGHECAHIRRHDFRKNLFYELAAMFTGFHPITWFIKSRIAETRELVCDRMAAERLLDRRVYASSLLDLARKMPAAPSAVSPAVGMFDTGTLERRIMALTASQPRVSRIRRCLSGLTAIVLLSASAAVTGFLTRSVAAQSAAPKTQDKQGGKKQAGPDLSCTYYGRGEPQPGTCGRDKEDRSKYRCYFDADPARSEPQTACEWKVLRAEESRK